MKPNQDIRDLIKKSPLKSYEVARKLGYSSGSALSTKLQSSLSTEERENIIRIIKKMSEKREEIIRESNQKVLYKHSDSKENNIEKILKKINVLKSTLDNATTKSDFQEISYLAHEISNLI